LPPQISLASMILSPAELLQQRLLLHHSPLLQLLHL
jgi:hypothetical protein